MQYRNIDHWKCVRGVNVRLTVFFCEVQDGLCHSFKTSVTSKVQNGFIGVLC